MKALITVAIPTFKRNTYLQQCINAILQQTLLPSEIIIVDNSPDKEAWSVYSKYKGKKDTLIRYISEPKRGAAHARNTAIKKATYPHIAFIDDDCIAQKEWIYTCHSLLQTHKNGVITGKVLPVEPVTLFGLFEHYTTQNAFTAYNNTLSKSTKYIDTKNCVIPKNVILDHNISFDPRFQIIFEDIDFSLQLLTAKIPIITNKEMVVYHQARQSLSQLMIREWKKSFDYIRLVEKYQYFNLSSQLWNTIQGLPAIKEKLKKQQKANLKSQIILKKLLLKNKSVFFKLAFRILLIWSTIIRKFVSLIFLLKISFRA